MAPPLPLLAYRLAGYAARPFVSLLLRRRLARGKEDPLRIGERKGRPSLPRPAGQLIWFHAASVGETMSVLPLIDTLSGAGHAVLLTTGTRTSAALAASRLPGGAIHQFVPVDLARAVARFLDHWRPDLAIFCESEIWPMLLAETHRRAIPLGIVNGRMSEKAFRGWRRFPGTARTLLGACAFCLAQTETDAARYVKLGAQAEAAGNLKFDAPALPIDAEARATLIRAMEGRPVLLAASTHPGEEEAVLEASARIRDRIPDLLTVIAPRHPERGDEIAAAAAAGGLLMPRRSQGALPERRATTYLADTLGEMGLFYSLATLAFVGGTLAPIGGHNPIEPAKLGIPILHGPETDKNREVFAAFDAAEAAIPVADARALAEEAIRLLEDADARATLAINARTLIAASEGALARALGRIEAVLDKAGNLPGDRAFSGR